MPTGYTADLEGVSFPEFALRCARAFGALITMRDESLKTPIPDQIEPSKYSRNQLTISFATLAEIESWDETQAEAEAKTAYERILQRQRTRSQESDATRTQYEAMIQSVKAWTPPTADHVKLKDFMLEQLTESIEWDCSADFLKPVARSGQEYKHYRLCKILEEIDDQAKSYRQELERAWERTEWIRTLRASLQPSTD